MKKRNLLAIGLVLAVVFIMIVPAARAQDSDQDAYQFSQMIQDLHNDRANIESQLSIDPLANGYPHAKSYYDDLEDHYEHLFLTADVINAGLT